MMDKAASFFGYSVLFLLSALPSTIGTINTTRVFRLSAKGFIEVRYEGKWGKICVSNFDQRAAGPICKQMGYMDTGYKIAYSNTPLTDIVVDNITCTGTTIDSGTFTPSNGNSKCPSPLPGADPIALKFICKPQTHVRLIKTESNAHSGIVEISRGTEIGLVCQDSAKVASIVCKQMGYSDGSYMSAIKKPTGYKGKVFDVACSTESLDKCTMTENAPCNQVQRVQCQVDSASQTTFKIDVSISSERQNKSENGTVEIKQYGKWGVICDTGWDSKDADVVCRELGYKNSLATSGFPKEAYYGQGTGVVFWNNVKCTGDEPSVEECTHDVVWGTKTCNSFNAAGVRCSDVKLPTFDFCSKDSDNYFIPQGVSFLVSPGYPNTFSYKSWTTCSCLPTDRNIAGTLSAYVNQKTFSGNNIEYLTLMNGSVDHELYGENTTAGPFESSVKKFMIEFRSNDIGTSGEGMFRIQLKASAPVNLTCTKTVPTPSPPVTGCITSAKPSGTPTTNTGTVYVTTPSVVAAGMIAGIVVGVIIAIVAITIILIVLYKNKKICQGSSGSVDTLSKPENGGMENDGFGNKDEGMKDNVLYEPSPAAVTGNGNFSQNNSENAEEVKPKNKRNLEVTEPETGEQKANGGVLRPASGSAVRVNFPNRAYNAYQLEEPVKDVDVKEKEGSGPNDLKPQSGDPVYAAVNKPRSQKAAKGNQGTQSVGTEPTNPNQDVQNAEKLATDTPTPFIPGGNGLYAEVGSNNRTPRSLPPINKSYTPSSAYAVVELTPTQPKIDEKKEEKSPKKSGKKKKEKKKKKDGKSAKDTPSSGRHPRQEQTSCAVPKFDDGTYAEVGQKDPVGGNQSGATDESYDKLNFQGRGKPAAPTGGDATYDVVQKL